MAAVVIGFDGAINHAVEHLGSSNLTLKSEQRDCKIHLQGKECLHIAVDQLQQHFCFEMLPFVFDFK